MLPIKVKKGEKAFQIIGRIVGILRRLWPASRAPEQRNE